MAAVGRGKPVKLEAARSTRRQLRSQKQDMQKIMGSLDLAWGALSTINDGQKVW